MHTLGPSADRTEPTPGNEHNAYAHSCTCTESIKIVSKRLIVQYTMCVDDNIVIDSVRTAAAAAVTRERREFY